MASRLLSARTGTLFVVATPIGNVDDISLRARTVLGEVEIVAAEDTRRTGRLLDRLGIGKNGDRKLVSCHEHNEAKRIPELLDCLRGGGDVAVVSDAGTPLLSDPGYRLVSAAVEAGIDVSPIPGCSAAIAAASVAGLPTDQLLFIGFLPATSRKRKTRLAGLKSVAATVVIYESVHRISASLEDIEAELGPDRQMLAAREITKLHETFYRGTVESVRAQIAADPGSVKGEYTLVVAGADGEAEEPSASELDRVLNVLLSYLGVRQSAAAAAAILGGKKRDAYQRALELRESTDDQY